MDNQTNAKLSLRAIEVFVAVVEEAGVTRAAKRLGASPAAVSAQLSNLESVLGARLIERSSQHFALTSAGELFHPRAIRILDEISAASAALATSHVSPKMVLKVAVIEDFDPVVTTPWLTSIQHHYPNIKIHAKSGPSHESHSDLGNRAVDVIVAVETTDVPDWVEENAILNDPYILLVSEAAQKAKSLRELADYPFVRYSRDLLMGRQIEAHLRRNRFSPTRDCELSSNQMVFSMVEAKGGWAITTVSAFVSARKDAPTVLARSLPIPAFSRRISLYARKNALGDLPAEFSELLRGELARAFVDPVRSKLQSPAWMEGFEILS